MKKFKTSSPLMDEMLKMISQGLKTGQGPFGQAFGGYDPDEISSLFQKGVGDPARRQMMEKTLPGMQQGMVASGLNRSSGGQRMGNDMQMDMEQQLSEMLARQQMGAREGELNRQMQAINPILNTQTHQTYVQPGQQSGFQSMMAALAQVGGQAAGQAAGAYTGAKFAR